MIQRVLSATVAFVLALAAADAQAGAAPSANTHGFVTHAAFFSLESKQANLLDPQAFLADPTASAGPGPQGIVHSAGFRPAYGVDDPTAPVVNALGHPLGFDLGQWFGARGSVALAPLAVTPKRHSRSSAWFLMEDTVCLRITLVKMELHLRRSTEPPRQIPSPRLAAVLQNYKRAFREP